MHKQYTDKQRSVLWHYSLTEPDESPQPSNRFSIKDWLLLLLPILLVVASFLYLNLKFGQAKPAAVAQPPVAVEAPPVSKEFTIDKYLVPEHGVIQIEASNNTDRPVSIPQVIADDAYWEFNAVPSTLIPPGGVVTFTIPYPWVEGELPEVSLMTSQGKVIASEVEPTIEVSGTTTATTSSQ